jgi:hypothetical protein
MAAPERALDMLRPPMATDSIFGVPCAGSRESRRVGGEETLLPVWRQTERSDREVARIPRGDEQDDGYEPANAFILSRIPRSVLMTEQ